MLNTAHRCHLCNTFELMCWTKLEIKKYFKKCMGMATRQTCETASPWLAELPAAGKPDAETEKQP